MKTINKIFVFLQSQIIQHKISTKMKKVLLTLTVLLAFCGSIFAQESHWSDFDYHDYEQGGALVAAVSIDGNMIMPTYDNYDPEAGYYINYGYEVAAFVNDVCRGHSFLCYYDGDDYPTTNMMLIHYDPNATDTGVEVTFKLYDHANQKEYTFCTSSEPIVTGMDYTDYWDNLIILSFSSSFTKDINAYTQDGGYYLIASPLNQEVSPEDVLNMASNSYDLYAFDQSADDGLEWRNYHASAFETLEAGKGYLYANSEDVTLTFVGAPYQGDGVVTLYKDDNAEFAGWNLVGNPFNQTVYIDREEFYVMNGNGSEIITAENNTVDAMEGIFVVAETNGETMSFTPVDPNPGKGQIVLNVTQDRSNAIDRAIVRFGQGGVLPKFMLNENHTNVSITKNDSDFAVVRSNKNGRLPVNFKAAQDGVYFINVNADDVEVRYLHLIDHEEGADIDLLQNPTYRFEAKTNGKPNRFELVFRVGAGDFKELFSKGANTEDFSFCSDGNWIINNEGEAILQVVDINGQIMSSEEISGCVSKHIEAAPGVYMLRLIKGNDVKVQKVVIK